MEYEVAAIPILPAGAAPRGLPRPERTAVTPGAGGQQCRIPDLF
jgi:hypothetical protein